MIHKGVNQIVLQDVNFSYGDGNLYANGISAVLEKGKSYLLSGRNGCGKTTLVNILLKIWRDYQGNIILDGNDLKKFSREEISESFGLSFQKTPIFHDTIRNNISLGHEGNIDKLLPLLAFKDDLKMMDRNLDSWLKDTSSLSGGQAQKVGILRTLFCEKSMYIFDEATANLDYGAKSAFFELIGGLKKNHIILLISHEEDVRRYVDEVIEIVGGREKCM